MAVFYLIRYEEEESSGPFNSSDEKLQTKDSESDALNFVVDAMKDEVLRVLDIIKVDFYYAGTRYTPLEISIKKGKFNLTPLPQEEDK